MVLALSKGHRLISYCYAFGLRMRWPSASLAHNSPQNAHKNRNKLTLRERQSKEQFQQL